MSQIEMIATSVVRGHSFEELAVQPPGFLEIIRSETRVWVRDNLGVLSLPTLSLGTSRHLFHSGEDGDGSQDFG
jgi:hypothetical protein